MADDKTAPDAYEQFQREERYRQFVEASQGKLRLKRIGLWLMLGAVVLRALLLLAASPKDLSSGGTSVSWLEFLSGGGGWLLSVALMLYGAMSWLRAIGQRPEFCLAGLFVLLFPDRNKIEKVRDPKSAYEKPEGSVFSDW